MADEIIAQQHGGLVAAKVIDGSALAAQLGFIEDIIVHQRGHVDHLDDGGNDGVSLRELAAGFACQEHEGRAEHLASESADMLDKRIDASKIGFQLDMEKLLDGRQLIGDAIGQRGQ